MTQSSKPLQPKDTTNWLEFDNPADGNCAYYAFANSILPYLKKEKELGTTADGGSLHSKLMSLVTNYNKKYKPPIEIKNFDSLLDAYTIPSDNKQETINKNKDLLILLNNVFRQLLLANRHEEMEVAQIAVDNSSHARIDLVIRRNSIMNDLADYVIKVTNSVSPKDSELLDPPYSETKNQLDDKVVNSIKSKQQNKADIPKQNLNSINEEIAITCYLQLLARKAGYTYITDFSDIPLTDKQQLTPAGNRLIQECLYNNYEIYDLDEKSFSIENLVVALNKHLSGPFEVATTNRLTHLHNKMLSELFHAIKNNPDYEISEAVKEKYLTISNSNGSLTEFEINSIIKYIKKIFTNINDFISKMKLLDKIAINELYVDDNQFTKTGWIHFINELNKNPKELKKNEKKEFKENEKKEFKEKDPSNTLFEQYIIKRSKDKVWGTDVDLRELATLFNVELHIKTNNKDFHPTYQQNAGDQLPVYLINQDNNHWITHLDLPTLTPEKVASAKKSSVVKKAPKETPKETPKSNPEPNTPKKEVVNTAQSAPGAKPLTTPKKPEPPVKKVEKPKPPTPKITEVPKQPAPKPLPQQPAPKPLPAQPQEPKVVPLAKPPSIPAKPPFGQSPSFFNSPSAPLLLKPDSPAPVKQVFTGLSLTDMAKKADVKGGIKNYHRYRKFIQLRKEGDKPHHTNEPPVTMKEIKGIFQSYLPGNPFSYRHESRHHIALARAIVKECDTAPAPSVQDLMEFIISKSTKEPDIKVDGDFHQRLNFLCYRCYGTSYEAHLKTFTLTLKKTF